MEPFGNFIAGAWRPAATGESFEDRNPADVEDCLGRFPASGAEDAERAVAAVAAAWPSWAATAPEARAEVLRRTADIIAARTGDLARELTREEGKTLEEATGEVRRTAANFRLYAGEALHLYGETYPTDGGQLACTLRTPVGVVVAITPWNFPVSIPARKLGPALAAGNCVVFKPSEISPLMGHRLVEALLEAGLPPQTIALVHGQGPALGAALVRAPGVGAVTFTGSYAVGAAIQRTIGPDRRCQLEMGGKNPVVVLADADLDKAAAIILRGAFGLAGQACTGTSRVLVEASLHDALLQRLVAAAEAMTVGDGLGAGVKMGPLATAAQLDKVLTYIRRGQKEGAVLVAGGDRPAGAAYARGHFIRPTIFAEVPPQSCLAREEIFGPVLAVQRISGLDEAIRLANDVEYGLAAAIVTRDLAQALRFAREVDAGIVKVNSPTTGVALNAPFGGLKHSSNQAAKEQAGATVMDFYTHLKTVYLAA